MCKQAPEAPVALARVSLSPKPVSRTKEAVVHSTDVPRPIPQMYTTAHSTDVHYGPLQRTAAGDHSDVADSCQAL